MGSGIKIRVCQWLGLLVLSGLVTGESFAACPDGQVPESILESDYLRVATLNVAHGRKDGMNQMLQKTDTIRTNLMDVAQVLNRIDAHVVALQEADNVSAWSGKFNHVELLAELAHYPCTFHGSHARNRMYDFGTALLSKYPFFGTFSYSFKPSKPTTTKGIVIGALNWNPVGALQEPMRLKLVSVHLDFSRRSVRRAQIDEMVGVLSKIDGPMILMGDFNTDWLTEDSSLKYLAEQLDFAVFEPHAEGLSTYGDKGARLDWILISPGLRFREYAVVPDVISDHYAVAAEIVLQSDPEQGPANKHAEIDGNDRER
jgi:endonuclease/exonuclease/phosphatase family metal-dependent hydrolase